MSTKTRVLVVDDSQQMRRVLMRYLEMASQELEFFEAGNGEEAETALQECQVLGTPIDIITLDWMMPKFSGAEFLARMRSTEAFSHHPSVIMVTAETYAEQISHIIKYNVSAYITKPFTPEDIKTAFFKALSDLGGLKDAV